MFSKHHISNKLYDFLSGELAEAQRTSIEKHLASCARCSEEKKKLEEVLEALDQERPEVSELSEQYWESFWKTLEPSLEARPASPGVNELIERLKARRLAPVLSPNFAYAMIGFALGAVVTLGTLVLHLDRKSDSETPAVAETQPLLTESAGMNHVADEISEPFIRFFPRAKAFLIGVKNLEEPKEGIRDLAAVQETVTRLAAECRTLRRQTLDLREHQLLSELEVILLQLSKIRDESDAPKLDLVKEEIEKNNIVMKIRVHELAREVQHLHALQGGPNSNE